MIRHFILALILISNMWFILTVGCEYRNYKGEHKYIKTFRAHSKLQKSFTVLQSTKDIYPHDIGKLTYIGFLGAIITSISGIIIVPFSTFQYFLYDQKQAIFIFLCWIGFGSTWGMLALIVQGIDSILNQILWSKKK